VACKGCARRRARLQGWLRGKLGITPMLERSIRADQELAKSIDLTGSRIMERVTAVENEMRGQYQLQRAKFDAMDTAAGKWFEEVELRLTVLAAKIDTQQLALRNERADRTELADKLADLVTEVSELTETVTKLEFPEFEKIDVTLDD
jgi:hypothetical protein